MQAYKEVLKGSQAWQCSECTRNSTSSAIFTLTIDMGHVAYITACYVNEKVISVQGYQSVQNYSGIDNALNMKMSIN